MPRNLPDFFSCVNSNHSAEGRNFLPAGGLLPLVRALFCASGCPALFRCESFSGRSIAVFGAGLAFLILIHRHGVAKLRICMNGKGVFEV